MHLLGQDGGLHVEADVAKEAHSRLVSVYGSDVGELVNEEVRRIWRVSSDGSCPFVEWHNFKS